MLNEVRDRKVRDRKVRDRKVRDRKMPFCARTRGRMRLRFGQLGAGERRLLDAYVAFDQTVA